MAYSSSLTDKEWEIIEPLLPKKKRTKPPTWSKREILDGVFYQLKNGCNWCDLPRDLPTPFGLKSEVRSQQGILFAAASQKQ